MVWGVGEKEDLKPSSCPNPQPVPLLYSWALLSAKTIRNHFGSRAILRLKAAKLSPLREPYLKGIIIRKHICSFGSHGTRSS